VTPYDAALLQILGSRDPDRPGINSFDHAFHLVSRRVETGFKEEGGTKHTELDMTDSFMAFSAS
jgi:hypothetical protein